MQLRPAASTLATTTHWLVFRNVSKGRHVSSLFHSNEVLDLFSLAVINNENEINESAGASHTFTLGVRRRTLRGAVTCFGRLQDRSFENSTFFVNIFFICSFDVFFPKRSGQTVCVYFVYLKIFDNFFFLMTERFSNMFD